MIVSKLAGISILLIFGSAKTSLCSTFTSARVIFMSTGLRATLLAGQLKLSPPWTTVVQHVNENYSVKCEGVGEKVWRHGNVQIIDTNRGRSSIAVEKKTNENAVYLKLKGIQKEFKGFYNCSEKVNGKIYDKGFELIVVNPVTFINENSPESVDHSDGDNIVLNCLPRGEPAPVISWFFNDKPISTSLDTNAIRVRTNNSLKITKASWRNSGKYTCRAFQEILQTRNAEFTYHVKIKHQPVSDTGQTNVTIYGFQNEIKNVTCQVHAYPLAYFIWYRHNEPLDLRKLGMKVYNEENISILEISLSNDQMWGSYDCEAANALGLAIHTFNLQQIDKPATPSLLIHECSDSAAVLSVIIEPYPTYPFVCHFDCTEYTYCSYEEKWKRGFGVQCEAARIDGTNKTHCKLDGLKPLTKYAVRATIVNSGGRGDFSAELIFRTREDLPTLLSTSASVMGQKSLALLSGNLIFVYLRQPILF